jgi:AcrR family transcriptional regulator
MVARTTELRADARHNREAILAVATEALMESADISMNAVAKRAGVGNATLHRNFPTRDALILAVYRNEVEQLAANAFELLEEHDPSDALERWVGRLAQYAMTKRGLAGALQAAAYSEEEHFAETYDPIADALTALLHAGVSAELIRDDVDAHDVLLALAGLWQMNPQGDWQGQARRLYDIVLGGIARR